MWEGFPLTVKAFEDNKAESAAAPAVVRHSQQRIDVNGVAVGANAGVFSQDNTDGQIRAHADRVGYGADGCCLQ